LVGAKDTFIPSTQGGDEDHGISSPPCRLSSEEPELDPDPDPLEFDPDPESEPDPPSPSGELSDGGVEGGASSVGPESSLPEP
jgi:hypothetical protein